MRIGAMIGDRPKAMDLVSIIADAQALERRGLTHVWLPQIFGADILTQFALIARETSTIALGAAVVPIQPRHPVIMAQQALTVQEAAGGRFILGVGLSHKMVIESMFGLSYDRPAQQMREYLSVLVPLVNGKRVSSRGEFYTANAELQFKDIAPAPVIVAALGPMMLNVAGALADGTVTWMTGPKTLENHIIPSIRQAAADAGRPDPTIIAGLPIAITDDVEAGRAAVNKFFRLYPAMPSYRAMLDREGVKLPGEIALVGNEDDVQRTLQHLEDAGMTDFLAAIATPDAAARERTLEFLAGLV